MNTDVNKGPLGISDADYARLAELTKEQVRLGPKALRSDWEHSGFWEPQWLRWDRLLTRGLIELAEIMPDALPLLWCRLYLSVTTPDTDTVLVQYSFENLYDRELPLNIRDSLLESNGIIYTLWSKEDLTSGQRRNFDSDGRLYDATFSRRRPVRIKPNILLPSSGYCYRYYQRWAP